MQHITDRKIRVGIVGCGRISANHFKSLEAHGNAMQLVAVCDTDPDVLRNTTAQHQVPGYDSLGEMLRHSDLDLVTLCTPSGLHSAQAIEAASAGRHVMTEKPMATRWADGLRMVRECDRAGVHLFVVKQNRRNATLQLLKRAVETGRFGRVYMSTINVFWARPQAYYDSAKWRGTWEFDGGALMNQASHYVDLVDWLIGPVESVQAYIATLARNIQVEDTATVGVRWRSGALGSVNVTMLAYPRNLEGSVTVIGEKGAARVGGVAVNEIQHWEFADSHPDDASIKSANYQTTSVYGFGHPRYYENVIEVLRGTAEPETDGREGLRSLELLIASYMSARDGRRVALRWSTELTFTVHPTAIVDDGAMIGDGSRIWHWTHVCGSARIGRDCSLGQNVFVGNRVVIGDQVKIQNNVSVYDNVTLESEVFCGPSVVFTNVYNPRSAVVRKDEYRDTLVRRGATLGANCTIVCGVIIGEYAFVAAGAVITRNVEPFALMAGVPARHIGWMSRHGSRLTLPLTGSGDATCPGTGQRYVLKDGVCALESSQDPA